MCRHVLPGALRVRSCNVNLLHVGHEELQVGVKLFLIGPVASLSGPRQNSSLQEARKLGILVQAVAAHVTARLVQSQMITGRVCCQIYGSIRAQLL